MNLPEDFHNRRLFDYIQLDKVTLLSYKSYSEEQTVYAFNTSNLLIFITKGQKIVKCAKEEFKAQQGELIFIKKGNYVMHQIASLTEGSYECLIACMSDIFLEQFYEKYQELIESVNLKENELRHAYKQQMAVPIKQEVEGLLLYFIKKFCYSEEILKLKLFEILLHCISREDRSEELIAVLKGLARHEHMNFQRFMEENFDKPYSVQEFAKAAGKSLSAFKNSFKKEFNDTPKNWVNKKRLEKAGGLLLTTDYHITEICYLSGFEDLSYFTRLFKRYHNISPRQYRVQNKTRIVKKSDL